MNKEYQEATNEYLKVRTLSLLSPFSVLLVWGFGEWRGEERRGEGRGESLDGGKRFMELFLGERDRWESREEGVGTTDLESSS
jgi:hypothetical protein